MKVIDQINGSALFAQSAYSASIATKDSLGRNITATYLTGINIPESATWNDTSNVVQSNSAQWGQGGGGTTYTSPSGTILINDNTLEATTSAITQFADTASITYDDYFYVSSMPNYPYSTYKFKSDGEYAIVVASYGEIYAENYETDQQGFATIPATYNGYDLTVVYSEGVLSGIKPNVVELATKSALPTYQYDSTNKISAINGSAIAAGQGGASYTAGDNIDITNNVISVSDVSNLSAGDGISIIQDSSYTTISWFNDAGIKNVVYTASLPATPDNNTLYLIPET